MVKIIKNGRVIDPESRFDGRADLWIENGKIQKIVKKDTKAESDGASDAPSIPADAEVLDAEGLIVAPGLVDTLAPQNLTKNLLFSCEVPSFSGRLWQRSGGSVV